MGAALWLVFTQKTRTTQDSFPFLAVCLCTMRNLILGVAIEKRRERTARRKGKEWIMNGVGEEAHGEQWDIVIFLLNYC